MLFCNYLKSLFFFSLDVNDNPPEFTEKVQHVSVPENTVIGTEIARVLAVSKDEGVNAIIKYSIKSSASLFKVHSTTGKL